MKTKILKRRFTIIVERVVRRFAMSTWNVHDRERESTPLQLLFSMPPAEITPSVVVFNRLYEENKDRLLMTQSFPIDQTELQAWQAAVSASGDTIAAQASTAVALGVQHIGFTQFYETLLGGAREAVALCQREHRRIVLLVSGTTHKSNFWCALLVWPVLRDYVTRIIFSWKESRVSEEAEAQRSLLVVYVDDGLFSGTQAIVSFGYNDFANFLSSTNRRVKLMMLVSAATSHGQRYIARQGYSAVMWPTRLIRIFTLMESTIGINDDFEYYPGQDEEYRTKEAQFKEFLKATRRSAHKQH